MIIKSSPVNTTTVNTGSTRSLIITILFRFQMYYNYENSLTMLSPHPDVEVVPVIVNTPLLRNLLKTKCTVGVAVGFVHHGLSEYSS